MQGVQEDVQSNILNRLEDAISINVESESTHLQLDPTKKNTAKESHLVIAGDPTVGSGVVGTEVTLKFEFNEEQPETVKKEGENIWVAERTFTIAPLSPRKRELAVWSFVELTKMFGGDSLHTVLKQAREDYVFFFKLDYAISVLVLTLLGRDPDEVEYLEFGSGATAFIGMLDTNPNLVTEIESFLGLSGQINP